MGSLDRAIAPTCKTGDPLAVGRSAIDAALGHRYLRVEVRNCTKRPVDLTKPTITGTTATGDTGTIRLTLTPVANRPERPFALAPGATAYAGMEWLVEPRSGRLQELHVAAASVDVQDPVPVDDLEMRLSTRLDYFPWVVDADDVF
ncbi:MAG: DUF4232 domain-containing protein [Ornithinimicrobium sp.]